MAADCGKAGVAGVAIAFVDEICEDLASLSTVAGLANGEACVEVGAEVTSWLSSLKPLAGSFGFA